MQLYSVHHAESTGGRLQWHDHTDYEMVYIVSGNADFTLAGRTYTAGSGSLLFLNPSERHSVLAAPRLYCRYYMLIRPEQFHQWVNDPRLASVFTRRPDGFSHLLHVPPALRPMVLETFEAMHAEMHPPSEFCSESLGSHLSLLLIRLFRSCPDAFPLRLTDASSKKIADIQRYMETHFTGPLTLKDVASRFYLDMYYLSHLFRENCGFTFKHYLVQLRLAHARHLLLSTDLDVGSICEACGLNNLNSFIRLFRKYEAVTPHQFRLQHKKTEAPKNFC